MSVETPTLTTEETQELVVNDDFSFVGRTDGKTYTLQVKQKDFADYYLEFKGDGVEAIIEAGYDVNYKNKKGEDTGVPNRKLASVMAYENLRKPHIIAYINSKLEEYGFNDDSVEKQHLFLLNQHADLKTKMKAVDIFYKVRGKYPKEAKGDVNINVFSLAELADKSTKRKQLGAEDVKVIDAEPSHDTVLDT
jgi:hypothetical protein